jgi:predicted dehydrogenase
VLRIGALSSTGTVRKRIVPALLRSDISRVTVAHGRSDARLAELLGEDPSIHLARSEDEFLGLRDHYDIVYIGSPPFLHQRHIELALSLGLPVICEKPLVADLEHLEPVVALVKASRLPFMVAHHVRHQRAIDDIVAILASGRLGSPRSARLQWCFMMDHASRNSRWKLQPDLGGSSVMFDAGVHAIDLALVLFGPPKAVTAFGRHVRTSAVYDAVVTVLRYPQLVVTVVASQSHPAASNDLTVECDSGSLHARGLFSEASVRTVDLVQGSHRAELKYEPVDLYRAEVENFCCSLTDCRPVGTTLSDAAVAARILMAAEESISRGREIPLTGSG